MYDKHSNMTKVDEARLHLFAQKQRSYDSIPPTSASLVQHVKALLIEVKIVTKTFQAYQKEAQLQHIVYCQRDLKSLYKIDKIILQRTLFLDPF